MHAVVYDKTTAGGGAGSAVSYFAALDKSITLAGKTGTAQTNQNEDDNAAWFVGFTPYENPDVAFVTFLEKGMTSGNAAKLTKKVLELYYSLQSERAEGSDEDMTVVK